MVDAVERRTWIQQAMIIDEQKNFADREALPL